MIDTRWMDDKLEPVSEDIQDIYMILKFGKIETREQGTVILIPYCPDFHARVSVPNGKTTISEAAAQELHNQLNLAITRINDAANI